MPIAQDIDALIEAAKASPATFDPLKFLDQAGSLLRQAYSEGGECDVASPKFHDIQGPYFAAADALSLNGFEWAAEQLLFEWWNGVGARQLKEKRHLYRPNCAYKLTQLYIRRGDRGAALRWALLTQADDLLSKHPQGGGAGKQWLRTTLGMSETELEALEAIATEHLRTIETGSDDFSRVVWFAEDISVRLALRDISFAHLFSQPSSFQEFPLSPAYFGVLLDRVDAPGTSSQNKGIALEDLASHLFLLVPGWIPRRDVLDKNQGFETDLIVSNLNPTSNLSAELLGRYFLVECKNWEEAVGVRDVGYFLHRMRLTHCSFGVILVKNKVTGELHGETAARSIIRRAFHEDGNTCIVLDWNDFESIAKGEITFWSLILREIEHFRFGEPKRSS